MHHRAFGRRPEDLDVVIVEDSRPMQTILRSILSAYGARRLRIYDRADHALKEMLTDPPHLVVTDWCMAPMSGFRLVQMIRHKDLAPLCRAAVIMVTGCATRPMVDRAFRIGVHQVLVKPISPSLLQRRLDALLRDDRNYVLRGNSYVIGGLDEMLDERLERSRRHARLNAREPMADEPDPAPAGAPAPDDAMPPAGERVRAEIDSSVWGG